MPNNLASLNTTLQKFCLSLRTINLFLPSAIRKYHVSVSSKSPPHSTFDRPHSPSSSTFFLVWHLFNSSTLVQIIFVFKINTLVEQHSSNNTRRTTPQLLHKPPMDFPWTPTLN